MYIPQTFHRHASATYAYAVILQHILENSICIHGSSAYTYQLPTHIRQTSTHTPTHTYTFMLQHVLENSIDMHHSRKQVTRPRIHVIRVNMSDTHAHTRQSCVRTHHPPPHIRSCYSTFWKIPYIYSHSTRVYVIRPRTYVTRANKSHAHAFSKSAFPNNGYKRNAKTTFKKINNFILIVTNIGEKK
jgi:hypothetical protein